jgi:glucosyl-dolichyl phosphate glucuronosyltransferase
VDVSVIICAFTLERWEMLAQAVVSVRRQTLPAREIILVIDGNEALQHRAEAELPGTTVLANRHGPGLSGARQTGSELATSTILAFLDDDAIADPNWLEELVAPYDDPHALGVGGSVEPAWVANQPRWLPPEFYWVVGCTYAGLPSTGGRIRNPIGANMSMRAAVLARTGSFEPRLARTNRGTKMSGTAEETEFCIRAARLHPGGYWAYRPSARARHAVPAERTTGRYFVRRCRLEAAAKAILTGLAGPSEGLASERAYVRSALPRAVARELRQAARGHPIGLLRATVIVAGLAITALSYLEQRLRLRWSGEPGPA